ncbi:peptidyl-prolyl cis-trans isomerase [Micromonospora sp. NPDC000018]|uniref:DUF7158 domain-containing protein n=1 Tax=Micromonospora sp. NPDC000018 TaxID=3154239 RepID=UPI003323AC72
MTAPAPNAVAEPDPAEVAGYVDGRPVPRSLVDQRIAGLRAGPQASALPAPGTPEDRQLARWVAQIVLVEQLCLAEARARGLCLEKAPGPGLDQRDAAELGSIYAAAYVTEPAVRAVYAAVTADIDADETQVRSLYRYRVAGAGEQTRWQLRYGLFDSAESGRNADGRALPSLGAVRLSELPGALAAAVVAAQPGDTVGPIADQLGWHVVFVEAEATSAAATSRQVAARSRTAVRQAERRRAFAHWLDRQRTRRIALVPGLEHPGDPHQPDNHHRH